MRKFKNKKLFMSIVAFVMVFVMAGAFASFQALLDINARVNMYAPTVDAIISTFSNTVQPLPHGVPGAVDNPQFRAGGPGTRFPDRQIMALPPADWATVGAGSAWAFRWANPGMAAGGAGGVGSAPDSGFVQAGTIPNVQDYQTVYVVVNFDNFEQTYEFNFRLANVGVVPLTVTDYDIEHVAVDPVTGEWIAAALVAHTPEARALTTFGTFVNIGGNFNNLRDTEIPPVDPAGGPGHNETDLHTISFSVDLASWTRWAAGLTAAEISAAENVSRDLAFRIRFPVVPNL